MSVRIIIGDAREELKKLPSESVHCVVTSPPYWGLRDYGVDGQIGLEETPQQFVDQMVMLFRDVRRVLRADGTLWFNIGDSYANDGKFGGETGGKQAYLDSASLLRNGREKRITGLKPKDLVGIPWRCAFALQADGWYLRQEIIWHKPNPMPESVTDRCTKAHEQFFLFSKNETYFYDSDAIAEDASQNTHSRGAGASPKSAGEDSMVRAKGSFHASTTAILEKRNKRSVWMVATQGFSEAHFATFPPALIEPSVLAGTSERGCCMRCGRGWERVTIDVESGKTHKMPDGMATYAGGHSAIHKDGREKGASDNPVTVRETIGWYPACRCEGLPTLPAYPDKPSRAKLADETRYKAAMAEWRTTSRKIDVARKHLCEDAADRSTRPAVVLDPFGGAGTTGLVADRLQRDAILIELNPEYAAMAERRIHGDAPLFAQAKSEAAE